MLGKKIGNHNFLIFSVFIMKLCIIMYNTIMNSQDIQEIRKNAIENLEAEKGKCLTSSRLETLDAYENILSLIQHIAKLESKNEQLTDQVYTGFGGRN